MLLESVLEDQVREAFDEESSVPEQTLRSVRLRVLDRAARILRLPFDPSDHYSSPGGGGGGGLLSDEEGDRLVLSDATLRELDEAWHRLSSADRRTSAAERSVRERAFARAPHCASAKCLSRYVAVLAKKDAVRGCAREEESEEEEEWSARENAVAFHIGSNVLNRLLAVDGFRGVSPSSYRNYVRHLHDRVPPVEKKHLEAVRSLYESGVFVEGRHSGTLSAVCVFYVLLGLYSEKVGVRTEDFVRVAAEGALENASRFIRDHDEKGDFVFGGKKFETLARSYRKRLGEDRVLGWIAFEKLKEHGRTLHAMKFSF